ncbi:MAG: MOSC domain-containing protein, partial [Xanthomonadales bacterium]|nr:MOSC domain-containing protein [Xanthomonadales bacterium]
MNLTVTSLHIYPVKSLGGITLPEAELCHEGLRYDRQWMLLDRQGRFLSQRHLPGLTQIATGLNPGALMLEANGMEPLRIPFRERQGPVILTEVWGDACEVVDEGDPAAKWL